MFNSGGLQNPLRMICVHQATAAIAQIARNKKPGKIPGLKSYLI